jgi:hypothetical protein
MLEKCEHEMMSEIDHIDGNRLLNTSVDALCDYCEQKYKLDVPVLREQEVTTEQNEVRVNIADRHRRMFGYDVDDERQPSYVTGTAVSFFVPFDGDPELFKYRPSSFYMDTPHATICRDAIILTYTLLEHDANRVKSDFEHDLSQLRMNLKNVENDVSRFNSSLRVKAKERIETRRQKLLADQSLVAALGYPLRRRDDVPPTFIAPTVRRKPSITLPPASSSPFVREPALDIQEYEHILSVMSNMVAVIERSPSTFSGMKEEDIRQHFLVQLNGQYEGQATGETFNFEGKTDILIRVQGKNIFIAECKFWAGPQSLKEAIDQLLGYATWRDGKTAILVFNRGKQLSTVLPKIPEVVKGHPNFKRQVTFNSETGFRFTMAHRDDPNRELILTVLVFEVPS